MAEGDYGRLWRLRAVVAKGSYLRVAEQSIESDWRTGQHRKRGLLTNWRPETGPETAGAAVSCGSVD
jgi:hypothetical protein